MAVKLAGPGGRKFNLGQNSDMNVTPFVDVMLVLLIVFMVTAPLATTAIRIDLPTGESIHQPPATYVSITDGGQILVVQTGAAAKVSSLEMLGPDLAGMLGGPDPTADPVLVRADRHVKYGRFMAVMDRLQSDGYLKVGLISEQA